MPQDKWSQYEVKSPAAKTPAAKADKWAQYEATPSASAPAVSDTPAAPDLTTNTIDPATGTGYGLYRMGSYDYNQGQVSKPEIQVPYNRVQDAMAAGYKLHPDEAPRYQQDTTHNGPASRAAGAVKDFLARMTAPMPDTPVAGNAWQQASAAMGNIEKLPINVINRTARGLVGLPQGIAQTMGGIAQGDPSALESLNPVAMAENASRGAGEDAASLGPMAALGNLGGDAATMYLAGKYTPNVVDPMLAVAKKTGGIPESILRAATDTGEGPVQALVKDTRNANEKIADVNADRIERQRRDQVQADADHSADLLKLKQKYEQQVRDAAETARTGTAADREKYQGNQLAAKQKYEQAVRDAQQKYETKKAAAEQANADALHTYNQSIGKVAQQNREAAAAERAKADQTGRLHVAGSQIIYGLQQLDKSLRDRAAVMYDAVREKVGGVSLPGTDLAQAARTALGKISGTSETPKVFRDILGKYPEQEPQTIEYQGAQIPKGTPLYDVLAQHGAVASPPVTFADLQGYYSELGSELSKGTLPGDVYQATRALQESVGDMMQKMAKTAGPDTNTAFWNARVFYRKYMDTFHEPTGPSASGSPVAQALLAKDPMVAVDKFSGDSGSRGVADLRRYSDSLANLAQDAQRTAQAKVTVPARSSTSGIKSPKSTPVPTGPSLPLPPVLESAPAPRSANLPLPPVLPEPKTVPVELKSSETISASDIQKARENAFEARRQWIQHRGMIVATWPVFQAMRALWGGHIPSIPVMALETLGSAATVHAAVNMLNYPPMVEFLTRAQPGDVALVPPEMRGDLPGLVNLARQRGMRVSPALAAAVAGSSDSQQATPQPVPVGAAAQ